MAAPDRPTLGDAPIEARHQQQMRAIANALDDLLNGEQAETREVGFILMVFPFDAHDGRCNYISTAAREDVILLLKQQLARFEGMPETSGTA